MNFLIYLGTSRKNNKSQHIANYLNDFINKKENLNSEIISTQSLDLDFSDEGQDASSPEFSQKVKNADAFVLVVPEYNHGYPASLKYLLDLNLEEYRNKPVLLVGISSGDFGATRAIENLLPVLKKLGLITIPNDLYFSNIDDLLDDGQLKETDIWDRRTEKLISQIVNLSQALKQIQT